MNLSVLRPVRHTLTLLGLVSLLGLGPAAHAQQFYKWVDASGATHYSQTPPPASASQVKKPVQVSSKLPADSASAIAALNAKKVATDKAEGEAAKKRAEAAQKQAAAQAADRQRRAANAANCSTTRSAQALIETGRPLRERNAQGEYVPMDEAQKAQRIAQMQQYQKDNCL
jgi:hypothetical protein